MSLNDTGAVGHDSLEMCALSRDTSAIQILSSGNRLHCFGPPVTLPRGNEIEVCEVLFDEGTAKIRHENKLYFIYLQDLDLARLNAALSAGA